MIRFGFHRKIYILLIDIALFSCVFLSGCSSVSSTRAEIIPPETGETRESEKNIAPESTATLKAPVEDSDPEEEEFISTPEITATSPPEDWRDYPVIPNISPRAIEIYEQGIAMGNDPHRFSKVGDCQNITTFFLAPLEDPRLYSLGEEYAYLQEVIDWYSGSLKRKSLAVAGGLNVARVLSPFHADVDQCEPNEHSLSCELRVYNPSIAIVSLEENWNNRTSEEYEEYMRSILNKLISEGVLPILATKADNMEGDHSINSTIASLAAEYELPLWNFWRAVQPLPDHGLQEDGFHLTLGKPHFDSEDDMEAAWTWRNLTALQSLYAVWQAVNHH
jgi:hypothetical protein